MFKENKTFYFVDELNDDFSPTKGEIKTKKIDGSYVYVSKNPLYRLLSFVLRRAILPPVSFCYNKINFGVKFVNRKALKIARKKKRGYFIYGNHTQHTADAFIPFELVQPSRAGMIVSPETVSIPFVGSVAKILGSIALPSDLKATKNYLNCLEYEINRGTAIGIYPEAHIWPYYTSIRPFPDAAFHYPVKFNTPVYCFTNTYHQRRWRKTPKIITYVDGPFYPDESLNPTERKKKLRDDVFNTMKKRSMENTYEFYHYIKKEK